MQLTYVAILAACLLGTLPLEFVLRTRVYARWPRLLAAVVPVAVVFSLWDYAAIRAGWWHFDPRRVSGIRLASVPLEEILFFLVIPTCAVLTFEAVRVLKPHWTGGDE